MYPAEDCGRVPSKLSTPVSLTSKQRLEMEIASMETRLKELKEAKEILDRNPDMERLITILRDRGL